MKGLYLARRLAPYLLLLGFATGMLAGCGSSEPDAKQLVARVDGEELSQQQFTALLAKAKGVSSDNIAQAKLETLAKLVDEQLAVNLANAKKLDKKPEIAAAIEASRRAILAQAALELVVSDVPKVGDEEAKRFYADNPALYAERRVYTLQELVIKKPQAAADKLRAQVASAKRMDEVQAWLKDKKIEFAAGSSTKAAEDMAPSSLAKLQAAKDGQMLLLESNTAYTVVQRVSAQLQPISMTKALEGISALLSQQRAAQAYEQAKSDMLAKAKLEFLGEFSGKEDAVKSGIKPLAASADSDEAQANARVKADAKIVELGIKGL